MGLIPESKDAELVMLHEAALEIARRPFVSQTESDLALLVARLAELQREGSV